MSKATKVPVVDQYAVQKLSQRENRQKSKPKKHKAKTHNQNKNQTKTTEKSGIATSNGNYMLDDILCVIQRWPKTRNNTEQAQNTPKGHVGG